MGVIENSYQFLHKTTTFCRLTTNFPIRFVPFIIPTVRKGLWVLSMFRETLFCVVCLGTAISRLRYDNKLWTCNGKCFAECARAWRGAYGCGHTFTNIVNPTSLSSFGWKSMTGGERAQKSMNGIPLSSNSAIRTPFAHFSNFVSHRFKSQAASS